MAEQEWECVTARSELRNDIVERRDRLADAARDARWDDVLSLVDDRDFFFHRAVTVNSVRVAGRSGFAPLHQAAWHGDAGAAEALLERGAWLTLRTADGRMPADVAGARGHPELARRLAPPEVPNLVADLEAWLAALIVVRVRFLGTHWRMPQLGPLAEHPSDEVWCAVPGFYGGFAYQWLDRDEQSTLDVSSWCRVWGGSGQRHHITANGVALVEEGFV